MAGGREKERGGDPLDTRLHELWKPMGRLDAAT